MRKKVKLVKKLVKNLAFLPMEATNFLLYPFRILRNELKADKDSRFVFVLSFPRSGTTALGSLLQQPGANINYYGEFFALNHWNAKQRLLSKFYPFFSIRFLIGHIIQKKKWRYYQFERLRLNPEKVLSVLATVPGTHVFKIFPFHLYDESLKNLIKRFNPEIMFLRRNHLDRLVSHKKAMATGVWHGVSTDSVEVDIDPKQLDKYMKDYQDFYKKMFDCAITHNLNILDVEYETLFEPTNIKKVLNFILADPAKVAALNLVPRTLKQDSIGTSQQAFLKKVSNNDGKKEISDFNFHRINK